jgi:hypothetical protein
MVNPTIYQEKWLQRKPVTIVYIIYLLALISSNAIVLGYLKYKLYVWLVEVPLIMFWVFDYPP